MPPQKNFFHVKITNNIKEFTAKVITKLTKIINVLKNEKFNKSQKNVDALKACEKSLDEVNKVNEDLQTKKTQTPTSKDHDQNRP